MKSTIGHGPLLGIVSASVRIAVGQPVTPCCLAEERAPPGSKTNELLLSVQGLDDGLSMFLIGRVWCNPYSIA